MMGHSNFDNIEDLFKTTFENHKVAPSSMLEKKLRRKLFVSDFISLNPRKFNIGYVAVILVSGVFLIKSQSSSNIESISNDVSEKVIVAEKVSDIDNAELLSDEVIAEKTENTDLSSAVYAFYEPAVKSGCAPLEIKFENKSKNAKNISWDFGDGNKSSSKHPTYTFTKPGVYKVKLHATGNETSNSEHVEIITVYEKPSADFNIVSSDMESKMVAFENNSKSSSKAVWSFGDGHVSKELNPEHNYSNFSKYNVTMIAFSENGCSDTVSKVNTLMEKDYRMVFPALFKPNPVRANNGLYERQENQGFVFHPVNSGATEYDLKVYSNSGTKLFSSTNIKIGWNGYVNNRVAPPGTYVYEASGIYPNGEKFALKGQFTLRIDKAYLDYYNQ